MSRLLFASPTYGPTEPRANRSHRTAIMHAAEQGHTWVGDASPDKQKFDAARNNVAQIAVDATIEDAADYVFWCDSDVVLPADAVTKLLASGKDFITGIYFQRVAPHFPLIASFNGSSFHWMLRWPENVIAPIDGCGFGCVITSVQMLKEIEAPWFAFTKYSEDFDFCLKAKAAGYELFVDTGVLCKHLADPKGVGMDEFLAQDVTSLTSKVVEKE